MCMYRITTKEVIGPLDVYKAVVRPFTGPWSETVIVRGEWMKARNEPDSGKSSTYGTYTPGFHAYLNREDAVRACVNTLARRPATPTVEKVTVKGSVTFGTHDTSPAVSAEYIRFDKDPGGRKSCAWET